LPTFEFIGYRDPEVDDLIEQIRPQVKDLSYAKDIVFIRRPGADSQVVGLEGGEFPFVRVYTRQEARGKELISRLRHLFDVEILHLADFAPRQVET